MKQPFRTHLKSSDSLKTSYESIRAGFVALALEKNRRATPFVAQARALKTAATVATSPKELLLIGDIRQALITAAGVSGKASNHLEESDKLEAIHGLIRNFLEPAGTSFVEELVFRFLLTRGDSLGGAMRNVGGFMAQCKLTRCLIAYFRNAGRPIQWLPTDSTLWIELPEDDTDIEFRLRGLNWKSDKKERTLVYNLTIPFLKNNVDLCLFSCSPSDLDSDSKGSAELYVAVGELKGGIDPAGADEHWKTARTALNRIDVAFRRKSSKPKTFFVGAAIESKMAKEIWTMLQKGSLDNAANLTNDGHMDCISAWLCGL